MQSVINSVIGSKRGLILLLKTIQDTDCSRYIVNAWQYGYSLRRSLFPFHDASSSNQVTQITQPKTTSLSTDTHVMFISTAKLENLFIAWFKKMVSVSIARFHLHDSCMRVNLYDAIVRVMVLTDLW